MDIVCEQSITGDKAMSLDAEHSDADTFRQSVGLISEAMAQVGGEEDPTSAIDGFLQNLGSILQADAVHIIESNGKGVPNGTFEWHSSHFGEKVSDIANAYIETLPEWSCAVEGGNGFVAENVEASSPLYPELSERLNAQGVARFVIWPLALENDRIGFVAVDNPALVYVGMCDMLLKMSAACISTLLRHKRSVTYIHAAQNTDLLTGLCSKTSFQRILDSFISQIEPESMQLQWDVVYFNIRYFKEYNTKYGIDRGDALLRRTATVLRDAVGSDRATRYDADHFYALVESSRVQDVVKQVHEAMANDPLSHAQIGAGIYHLTGGESSAGQAIDRAKIAGDEAYGDYANYWRFYNASMEKDIELRSYVLNEVDRAVTRGWIKVHYQPVVGTLSGKVESLEALARWDDPVRGVLPPGQFINTLEHAHVAYKVDFEVLRQTCEALSKQRLRGFMSLPVSINISRHDFELTDFHERFDEILESYGIAHNAIHVEITETALVESEDLIRENVRKFHARGYEVWLDDFGSGYSSLNTLKSFAFDCAKLDIMFLRQNPDGLELFLQDLITLSKHMGIKTLAEGVETPEQLQMLRRIGCMMAQGYLFSKPLPIDRLVYTLLDQGFEAASPRERLFYSNLGMTDVVRGTYPFETDEGQVERRDGLTILVENRGVLKTVYANEPALEALEMMGVAPVENSDAMLNNGSWLSTTVRSCLQQTHEPGDIAETVLSVGRWHSFMRFSSYGQTVVCGGISLPRRFPTKDRASMRPRISRMCAVYSRRSSPSALKPIPSSIYTELSATEEMQRKKRT